MHVYNIPPWNFLVLQENLEIWWHDIIFRVLTNVDFSHETAQ